MIRPTTYDLRPVCVGRLQGASILLVQKGSAEVTIAGGATAPGMEGVEGTPVQLARGDVVLIGAGATVTVAAGDVGTSIFVASCNDRVFVA